MQVRILGLSGSLRRGSFNSALLTAAASLLPPSVELQVFAGLAGIPPFSEDREAAPPPAVRLLRATLATADALLVATPEYNGSVPGQLKNALDWASRPYPDSALQGKPAAVVGATTGIFGAVWAQADLRRILSVSGAKVLDRELAVANADTVFDGTRALVDDGVREALRDLLRELALNVRGSRTFERRGMS